ncbi:hypothetical protein A4D02_05085 [Niastella koreensis]|uniref:Uncharacterized protein n=1 Tax=Niastella koreensis TaxID=354356 RepID=A0ABX3P654_9BACT|nr:hypothetical protein [Niastella koreensis]OQP55678.1 hypothetical protein A4D02_05085 [Niastella koreensis]
MVKLKGKPEIGDFVNKKIFAPIRDANKMSDFANFNDDEKLGKSKLPWIKQQQKKIRNQERESRREFLNRNALLPGTKNTYCDFSRYKSRQKWH